MLSSPPGQTADGPSNRSFHFLELPPELRSQIYQYYFENLVSTYPVNTRPQAPVFLMTCKAIYTEALEDYWTAFSQSFTGEWGVKELVAAVPQTRLCKIRCITIKTAICEQDRCEFNVTMMRLAVAQCLGEAGAEGELQVRCVQCGAQVCEGITTI